ncbi:MAG: DNA polymerase I, partial [Candidatus Buchananbacteria bacterium RIFCSPHIGHO2_01_FULL_47_11b]
MPAKEKFIIIDGNALVHRSFHALPTTMRTRSGQMVNAVYGFTTTLLKVLRDLAPEYLVVTFDLAAPTFRHQAYKAYKATRVKQPDELYEQIPIIKEVVAAFDIPIYEQEGFEADDVIATLVRHKEVEKMQSIIVTGDMDTLQLVDANTEVYTMHKGISDTVTYDVAQVKKRFDGLTPEQVVDYKALRGDPSDNIPGVKGIGEKGAISLLQEFGTLENIYKNIDSKKISDRYRTLLTEHKKEAFESKALCQLVDTVPITLDLTAAARRGFDLGKVVPLFQRLEFKSLISRLPKEGRRGQAPGQAALEFGATPAATGPTGDYILVADDETFTDFFKKLGQQKIFAVDTETSSLERFTSELLGISFSWKGGQAWYVAATKNRLEKLKPILEDEGIKKVGHNVKFDLEMLANAGIALRGIAFDTMIASYLINPGSRQHNLDGLVFTELGHEMQPITELIGTGKNQISLKSVPLPRVSNYSCEDADYTWQLVEPLTKQLEEKNNLGLLKKIELPLIPILADMERTGVQLDTKLLKSMSVSVGKKIDALEEKIFKLAGTKFNVASPLQLKEILFAKLSISTEGIGRTKTGLSTAAAELEKMKGKHKIIDLIIEFRELSKLKSTYLDSLPKLTDANNRVHTSFNQTVAATGRLSSSDPNLQNIPIRTELGQKIRTAFIAPRGLRLLSVDYSQIELRIVASLANDAKMIASFNKGEDIHTRTAAEIHQVPLERV